MSLRRIPLAAAVVAVLGTVPSLSSAQSAAAGPATDDAQVAADTSGAVRAPTAEERQRLSDAQRLDQERAAELPMVVRPDGSSHAEVPEYLDSVSVARVENGRVVTRCFDDPTAANGFLEGAATPAAEEK